MAVFPETGAALSTTMGTRRSHVARFQRTVRLVTQFTDVFPNTSQTTDLNPIGQTGYVNPGYFVTNPAGVGQPVRRVEDFRLLTGQGCYSDDWRMEGQAHAVALRSPHAHARLVRIDATRAKQMPGVLAVQGFLSLPVSIRCNRDT